MFELIRSHLIEKKVDAKHIEYEVYYYDQSNPLVVKWNLKSLNESEITLYLW
jgi:hypothetical protein